MKFQKLNNLFLAKLIYIVNDNNSNIIYIKLHNLKKVKIEMKIAPLNGNGDVKY